MTRIKGTTVYLIDKVPSGKDPFGGVVYQKQKVAIHNVLIAPISTEEMLNDYTINGYKATYQLAIPKGDTHDWRGREVEFFNRKWRVVGDVLEGIESLIPLDWNRRIKVEQQQNST